MNIYYRHDNAHRFNILISITDLPDSFRTGNFIELRIMAMIYYTHLICECIVNPYLCFGNEHLLNEKLKVNSEK